MTQNPRYKIGGILLAATFSAWGTTTHAAEIKVLSDGPLQPALVKVVDIYGEETHNEVSMTFDLSPAVKKRIEGGETADVVIVRPDVMEDLTKSGEVVAGDRLIVGHVGVGLGNRNDGPAHDISKPDKLKDTLLGADMLVFNNVASGNAFEKVLERLGIAETLKPKIIRTPPNEIFEPVLKGKGNDIAAGTIPLIANTPGIKLLGPLPDDYQSSLTYVAAVVTKSSQPDAAEGFIKFLASAKGKASLAANGVN